MLIRSRRIRECHIVILANINKIWRIRITCREIKDCHIWSQQRASCLSLPHVRFCRLLSGCLLILFANIETLALIMQLAVTGRLRKKTTPRFYEVMGNFLDIEATWCNYACSSLSAERVFEAQDEVQPSISNHRCRLFPQRSCSIAEWNICIDIAMHLCVLKCSHTVILFGGGFISHLPPPFACAQVEPQCGVSLWIWDSASCEEHQKARLFLKGNLINCRFIILSLILVLNISI